MELLQLIHLNSPLAAEHSSPCFLQVVNLLFVVHGDPVFGAIPIFLGPICPTSRSSDPLRNLEIHACTVITGGSGCWRETMQVYVSGTSSHLFGEMSVTHSNPSLELLPYRQQRAISPAKTISSREASLENTLAVIVKFASLLNFRRATPFPMPKQV